MVFSRFSYNFANDKGLEFDNNLIDELCMNNSIKHIKNRPRHPQINGVVKVVHKEFRKIFFIKYAENDKDFDLKSTILDSVNIHNHNVHTKIGYKPCDIINNAASR